MAKKLLKRKKKNEEQLPSRITNDTVAQHREKILAGGRKHKYPLQYTKYKVVWNTVILSIVAVIVAVAFVWIQLYVRKDTGDVTYRITQILPLPVASVDGSSVSYNRYLLYHRSTMAVTKNQEAAADKLEFQRQQAMDRAVEDTYAEKIAKERDITVTDEQVNALIDKQQQDSKISKNSYEAVVEENLHWSMDELRRAVKATLLRQAVSFSVDQQASDTVKAIESEIQSKKTLEQIAKVHGKSVQYVPGVTVPKDNSDGGLSQAAAKLKPGVVSGAIKTLAGDGYYFIVLQKSDSQSLTYDYIKVPLTVFSKQFEALKSDDKIHYYIDIK